MHGQPSAGKSRVDRAESLSGEGNENVVDKLVSICNWSQIDWAGISIAPGKRTFPQKVVKLLDAQPFHFIFRLVMSQQGKHVIREHI